MGTQIKNIVPTSFSIATVPQTSDAFGIPLVLGEISDSWGSTGVVSLTSVDDLATYSITSVTHPEIYKCVLDYFSQESKDGKTVSLVKLGNKKANHNCKQSFVFDADATGGTFTITLGTETTGNIAYNGSVADVKAALEALEAIHEVTVTLNTDATVITHKEGFTVEFTGADANTDFALMVGNVSSLTSVTSCTETKTQTGTAVETWADSYGRQKLLDPDFFILTPAVKDGGVSGTITELVALAAAVEPDPRIVVFTTDDAVVKTAGTSDLAYQLKELAYDCFVIYSGDSGSNAGSAVMGAMLPDFLPGVNPVMYPLTGVIADTLSATEIGYIAGKNCNRIESVGGYTMIPGVDLVASNGANKGGICSSGQFLDLVAAKYYLNQKVSEGVFQMLVDNKKIPFTAVGLKMIEMKIMALMVEYGVNTGIVTADSIVITMPDLATYGSVKKAQRWLDGVDGTGTLQGAISKITIGFDLVI